MTRDVRNLPLFLDPQAVKCLVVGGGEVAYRKLVLLLEAGAHCRIVAPRLSVEVADLAAEHGLEHVARPFEDADIDGRNLVIAATDDVAVNEYVHDVCVRLGIWVNTVDNAALSTAIFPSIVDRDPVTVAISTGGASPTLARRIRAQVEALLPSGFGRLAEFLRAKRVTVRETIDDVRQRQRFWDAMLDGAFTDLVLDNRMADAERTFVDALGSLEPATGFVSLVGAGPGDPDLLTQKALTCLRRADVVYYDNLVGPGILDRARRDAKRVYVGKRRRFASVRQEGINELLLRDAQNGLRVVRLKGGDPFIFGRGGEEIATLAEHGIPFEIVPGITAALGCAASAGIPLTHRDWAQSVRFVTGHLKDDRVNLDWPELAKPDQTLVVYMGLVGLPEVMRNLVKHGMDPQTPVAVISRGTLPDQRVVRGTLGEIAEAVRAADLPGPTTTIIGRVAGLGIVGPSAAAAGADGAECGNPDE